MRIRISNNDLGDNGITDSFFTREELWIAETQTNLLFNMSRWKI